MKQFLQENLTIEGTKLLPFVDFKTDGYMQIEGRIIPDDVVLFFKPLLDWCKKLASNKAVLDIKIEYLNTNALVHLYKMLEILELNCNLEEIIVNWYYEEEDEEYYDKGLYMAEKLKRIKFQFQSFIESD